MHKTHKCSPYEAYRVAHNESSGFGSKICERKKRVFIHENSHFSVLFKSNKKAKRGHFSPAAPTKSSHLKRLIVFACFEEVILKFKMQAA